MERTIKRWLEVKTEMDNLKKVELDLRKKILDSAFGEPGIGTHKRFIEGYDIKGSYGVTTSLDQEGIKTAMECDLLTEEQYECVRIKFELDKRKYDVLDESELKGLDMYITQKPSLPSLSITQAEE